MNTWIEICGDLDWTQPRVNTYGDGHTSTVNIYHLAVEIPERHDGLGKILVAEALANGHRDFRTGSRFNYKARLNFD